MVVGPYRASILHTTGYTRVAVGMEGTAAGRATTRKDNYTRAVWSSGAPV